MKQTENEFTKLLMRVSFIYIFFLKKNLQTFH